MSYDDIAAAYLTPLAEPIPVPAVGASAARRLRDALEPIATQGWWSRASSDRLVALGLGFFDGYVWGRAASLGTPAPAVVVATFGVFEPGLLTAVYSQGVAVASRDDVLAARADGAAASLAALVSDARGGGRRRPAAGRHGRPRGCRPAAVQRAAGPAGARERRPGACGGRPSWSASTAATATWRRPPSPGSTPPPSTSSPSCGSATGLGEYSGTRGFGAERLDAALAWLEERGWADGRER